MPNKDSRRIQEMFGSIAPSYDLLNHVFSLNIDKMWRRKTVKIALKRKDQMVLDVACGTGELTRELKRSASSKCRVFGADFCLPMLAIAKKNDSPPVLQGDGLRLPFPDQTFDLLTIGFGLRNMENLKAGLKEMRRVLKPGGRLAVLEFTTPKNILIRMGYLTYFRFILPAIGKFVTRSNAYYYLSDSVMEWPDRQKLARIMRQCGYRSVRSRPLTFGIAAIHIAQK